MRWRAWGSWVFCSALLSCAGTVPGERLDRLPPVRPALDRSEGREPTRNVILVTLDGVRWQDVFYGADPVLGKSLPAEEKLSADALMPNLYRRLAPSGVIVGAPGHGQPITTGGANVSLPGYLEILTGVVPTDCTNNDCVGARGATLLDEIRDGVALRDEDVALIGSWERLERAAVTKGSRFVVSTGRNGGGVRRTALEKDPRLAGLLRAGEGCGPAPGHDDYRHDACTAELALAYLESAAPRFLHVGLGDTDEHAHAGDYRSYLAALRRQDAFLGRLLDSLETSGRRAETTVLVTADHGRSHDFHGHGANHPESSRVWLFAAGGQIAPLGYAETTHRTTLASVAPTVRLLLGLPQRTGAAALSVIAGPLDERTLVSVRGR